MSKHRSKTKPQAKPQNVTRGTNSRPWLLILGGALLIALAIVLFTNLSPASTGAPPEISVAEAAEKYADGVFFLDVRTPEEWNDIHIPNTTLIPLDELKNRVNELPGGVEIVVVCRSGNRSQEGRDILLSAGFEQVSSMAGGVREWSAAGYPTTNGS